jgi:hypothetical protein
MMRLGGILAIWGVLTAAARLAAQQPSPQLIVNPYFRATPTAPESAVSASPAIAPPVAPTAVTTETVRRLTNETWPIRALGAAVRTTAAAPTATDAGRAPLRFIPPADAKPILGTTRPQMYDTSVTAASAVQPKPVDEPQAEIAPTAGVSLAEAVSRNLQVTHLASNPLRREAERPAAPLPPRATNPLR